jgi:hypothetical protein
VGALILAQLPAYSKDVLGGDKTVYTLLLASFSIGTALGSLACERLSATRWRSASCPGLDRHDGVPAAPVLRASARAAMPAPRAHLEQLPRRRRLEVRSTAR